MPFWFGSCACFLPYLCTGPQSSLFSMSHFPLYFIVYLPILFCTFKISFVLFLFSPLITQIDNICCNKGLIFRVILSKYLICGFYHCCIEGRDNIVYVHISGVFSRNVSGMNFPPVIALNVHFYWTILFKYR